MKDYIVRAKMNKDDDTYREYLVTAFRMETRYGGGAVFFNMADIMIAYFPIVYSVQARQ